ncbi:Two component system response regulator/histidine kinase, PAS domain-containing [Desulfonema limicola]|uniref:histidine kinase n=1 Tax=Desulfonema limicola TaxID=45656 RepID=A0A975B8Y4_9BACT|nr:ATP-binding protein [Desulfonema limicola]QTA80765.1 Two component system response regulator/histidine kinase, PAS domain-containing [Desulfonema limicola]
MNFLEKKELLQKIAALEEEKADLEIMLEAVTGHSEGVEEQLLQKVRKMVEASEKRFRLITETIPVPVLVTQEKDGLIVFANHYASDLFKIPLSSLPGHYAQEFYDPSQRQELLEHIKKHGLLKNHEIKGKRADGTSFRAELTVQPFYYNEKSCLMSVWYDITKQRILESRLRQSQKMEAVGTLAGGIAHDFNNILTAIFGYTELSMSMVSQESLLYQNLKQIFNSAVRAKELVMQILSFCRKSDYIIKLFNIIPVIEDAVKMLKQIIPSHITVNLSFKNQNLIIKGDPTQIQQVIMNLCSNAADAIQGTCGCIDIFIEKADMLTTDKLFMPELEPDLNYVRISIIDNGQGMSKKLVSQIFDPFFTTKPPGQGTGMGLSVVHGVVKNHNGLIYVESKPGRGTAFHVYFPAVQADDEKTEEEKTKEEEKTDSARGHILLIDDEDNILEAYKQILENLGYKADISHNGRDALKLFKQNPDYYDLVITDYSMPGMTGGKLAEKIIHIRPNIPVIIYTGHHNPLIPEYAQKNGVIDFLTKPFTQNELTATLQKYLQPDNQS